MFFFFLFLIVLHFPFFFLLLAFLLIFHFSINFRFLTFGKVKGNARYGRSRHQPTNQSLVCEVNLATLKVAINMHCRSADHHSNLLASQNQVSRYQLRAQLN